MNEEVRVTVIATGFDKEDKIKKVELGAKQSYDEEELYIPPFLRKNKGK
jgi:cell division GTPase FtsZ